MWVSSYFIVDEFRKTMADPYLAFFTLLATWSWICACSPKSRGFFITFYIALCRWACSRRDRSFSSSSRRTSSCITCCTVAAFPGPVVHALGVIIFLVVGMWWYVAIYRSVPNAMELWRYESIGELSDNTEKARHWWFYLPNLLQITLPWTPLWLLGLSIRSPIDSARRLFAVACTAVVVFVFSLSFVKKNAYLLPLVPIQTIVTAQGLLWLTVIFRKSPKHRPCARCRCAHRGACRRLRDWGSGSGQRVSVESGQQPIGQGCVQACGSNPARVAGHVAARVTIARRSERLPSTDLRDRRHQARSC